MKRTAISLFAVLALSTPSISLGATEDFGTKTTAEAEISFNFEGVNLETFLKEVEKIFSVSFIYDSQVKSAEVAGSSNTSKEKDKDTGEAKISFRTNKLFTKEQAWAVVDAFLNVAGLGRVKVAESDQIFRITKIDIARKEAVPSFIGTAPEELPESGLIRYVHFLKNSSAEQMRTTIESLKSKNGVLDIYQDLNALIFTDQAYNIKVLMKIVKELDSACTQVGISVLRLKEADAIEVAQLYDDLKNKSGNSQAGYGFGSNSKPSNQHFLQESNVFAEPRTNTLIIIGPPEANARIEQFIVEHIDTKLAKTRSNIHVIELNYVPAEQIATIFNELAGFGNGSEAAKYGGTRGGEKYFNKMSFEADKQTNNLIVRGEEEDFLAIKEIVKDLDKAQPQVAIEVLIVSLQTVKSRGISTQIHNRTKGAVNFQATGFGGTGIGNGSGPIVTDGSLVSNLIGLATSATAGSIVMSLGTNDVWSLLSVLSQDTKTNLISNPFLVTTNKYQAITRSGEERRILTQNIVSGGTTTTNGITPVTADLEVKITPRINSLGMVNLDVDVLIENFTSTNPSVGNKNTKEVHTNANVMDGEVLAIGGIIRNASTNAESGIPILSKIPIIGNFFKNKSQRTDKENLLVFIVPKIVNPQQNLDSYTKNKAQSVTNLMQQINKQNSIVDRDPISRWIFVDQKKKDVETIQSFAEKGTTTVPRPKSHRAISQAVEKYPETGA